MIDLDEEALICDLAETYHIYDYKSLPVNMVAIFSCGLRDNSRIKMKLGQQRIDVETSLLALAVDRLGYLVWSKTKDAETGKNRPQSMYEILTSAPKQEEQDHMTFNSIEEFELALKIAERR